MGGDADAATITVVAEAVIFADDLVAFHAPQAEGDSAVVADVAGGRERSVRKAIDDDTLVQECSGVGLIRHFMGEGDGGYQKGASARQSDSEKVQFLGRMTSRERSVERTSEMGTMDGCGVMGHYRPQGGGGAIRIR